MACCDAALVGVRQAISNKFTKMGRDVGRVQRALEATETTSNSQINTALEGVISLVKDVLECNIVSIYQVKGSCQTLRRL